MDSGASETVIGLNALTAVPLVQGQAAKNGVKYECANGAALANLGQKRMPVMTAEGTLRGYSTQCADVSKPLQSVRHLNKRGHLVVFDESNSFVYNKYSGEVNHIDDDGVNFTMKTWIMPKEALQQVAAMGFPRQA